MESADDDGRRQENNNDQREQRARARQQARQQHQQYLEQLQQQQQDLEQLEQQLEDMRQRPVIPQEEPQLLQLIDEEEWFNIYGLRADVNNNDNGVDDDNGDDDDDDAERFEPGQREIRNRVHLEQAYQNEIHAKIFAAEDAKEIEDENNEMIGGGKQNNCSTTKASPSSKRRRKQDQLDGWENDAIDIVTMASSTTTKYLSVVFRTNLKQLASHSETVFTMASASNKHLYNNNNNNNSNKNKNKNKNDRKTSSNNDRLSLSLCDYTTESVKIFLRVLFSSSSSLSSSASKDTDKDKNENNVDDMNIPPDYVIDCCRLAHYLQCEQLLDRIVDEYLMTSIDNDNCRFLCKLADQLSLPNLWEASVNHMLSSLDRLDNSSSSSSSSNKNNNDADEDSVDDNEDSNNNNLWNDMAPELKKEIQALRGILKSSNRKQIYFSTYHEYLALLAEQHQYYKERLQDAKDSYTVRLNEENNLIQELDSLQEERKSNWFGGGYTNIRLDRKIATSEDRLKGLIKGKEYVKPKIDRQIRKVDTLKTLLEEQKKIFGGGREENK
jgi:hypothetical protein